MSVRSLLVGAAGAAAVATTLVAAPAPAAHPAAPGAPTVDVEPARFDRGPNVRTPHLVGRTIVDGGVRVRVTGGDPFLLGRSLKGYTVVVRRGDRWNAERVAPGSARRVLLRGTDPGQVVLSDDGRWLASWKDRRHDTRVRVHNAVSGKQKAARSFARFSTVLDLHGREAAVSTGRHGASVWRAGSSRPRRVTNAVTYRADVGHDRIATFTGDPYAGGCTVVRRISRAGVLWRSCREAVTLFSPRSGRMVTTTKLADGLGPSRLWERALHGRLLAVYRTHGYFPGVSYEDGRHLLLDTDSGRRHAVIRCVVGECERASRLRPSDLS